MAMVWNLKSFLQENQITPNALAERVKGQVSKTAIYNLVKPELPVSVHFATLDVILPALTEMLKRPVQLEELLRYESEDPKEQPSWMALIGIWSKGEAIPAINSGLSEEDQHR